MPESSVFTFFPPCSDLKYNISQLIKSFIFMSNYYTHQLLVPLTVKVTRNYSNVSLCSIPVYPKVITKYSPSAVVPISQLKMRPLWNLMNLCSIYYEPGKGGTSNFLFNWSEVSSISLCNISAPAKDKALTVSFGVCIWPGSAF